MKKLLKITGIILLVLIASAFIVPVIFKGRILRMVKNEINKNLNAKVEFADLSLSLFRHFPRVSVQLDSLSVSGINEFLKDTLISASSLDASVNLWSLIRGNNVKVHGVYLESPRIHALVNKEGRANWDIVKADTGTTTVKTDTASSFTLSLEKYEINNGYILYRDESNDMNMEIRNLDHEGSGNLSEEEFTLVTKTKTPDVSFTYDNIPYLINAKADIDAGLQVNTATAKYSFKNADIALNNLKVLADGFFQLVNDSTYNMDISFKSPSNDFKDILSLVPAIYKKDFDKLKTAGKAVFSGFVKGLYSPQQMPAYNIDLGVKDGFFQYPDLPDAVKNIQLTMKVSNPDGIMDHAVVDITQAHLEMGNEPFDFHLLFKNPETSQYIDAVVKGRLNLAEVSKFVKLDAGTRLAGLLWADAYVKGNLSAISQQQGPFTAGGFFDITKLFYSSKDFPQPIQNGNLHVQLANQGGVADNTQINVQAAHIEVGADPVDFSLELRKPVSTVDFSGKARGRFTLDNIKQFVQLEPGTAIKGVMTADLSFTGNKAAIDKKEYDKINTTGAVAFNNLSYVSTGYPGGVKIQNAQLAFNPKSVTLSNLAGNYQQTNFTANGVLNNLVGYVMNSQPLGGTLNVTADKLNLNDWMGTDTTTSTQSTASSGPFLVPSNINLAVNARAGEVKYDKVTYNNINGTLVLNDETVKLQNVNTTALDGTINFNGSYSTKENKKQPAISISYDVKDVDVQKAFFAFNTLQKLMPVGKFLAGKLSSQLKMTGSLGGNMMPDLGSLTGNGNLLLIKGILSKFQPLEKLAGVLQINELKEITIKDIKNYIEFANGKVLVKPFTIKVKDIEMQIGGMHGFDQSLDYIIQMKVPRKYLGDQANRFISDLTMQAASKGIPVKLDDMVSLSIKMGGTLTNPTIKTDLKEAAGDIATELKQQAVDFAKQKIDSAKRNVKDSLNSIKKQVTNDLKEEFKKQIFGNKDSANNKQASLDSSKKKATETIRNTINDLFNKKKKAAADSARGN